MFNELRPHYNSYADTPSTSDLDKALVNYLPVLLGFVTGGLCKTAKLSVVKFAIFWSTVYILF